jgi:hypothetical protein
MSQRGIHKELIDLVLIYGHLKKDKLILNNKRLEKYLKKLDAQHRKVKRSGNQLHLQSLNKARSTLLKLRDKGGVTLVIMGETLITTYNTNMKIKRKRRYKSQKK